MGKSTWKRLRVLPLYRKYNVDKAVAVCADGESFIAEIFPWLRYIALCCEKSKNDFYFSEAYKKWLKNQALDAKKS